MLSQPSLAPLSNLVISQFLQRQRALMLRIPPYKWLAPHTADLLCHRRGSNLPTLAFKTHRFIGNQCLYVNFYPWKSNLQLIIALPKQHYNNPNHTRQLCRKLNSVSGERKIRIMMGDFHRRNAYDHGFWSHFIFNLLKRYPILLPWIL